MRIGGSLFLIAVGAILKWAVTDHVKNVDLSTVGVILMIVGAVGLVLSLIYSAMRRRTDVIHHGHREYVDGVMPANGQSTYVEPSSFQAHG